MEPETLRERLHKYIDIAEDKKIQAIYTILEDEMSSYSYDKEDIGMFHERRVSYLKGETSYSADESLELVRNVNKQYGL